MTMSGDLQSRLVPWNFQPRVWFRATFARSWLDASWSVADAQLPDQREQQANRVVATITQPTRGPFAPQLHGMFETQLAWMHGSVHGGLRHEQPIRL